MNEPHDSVQQEVETIEARLGQDRLPGFANGDQERRDALMYQCGFAAGQQAMASPQTSVRRWRRACLASAAGLLMMAGWQFSDQGWLPFATESSGVTGHGSASDFMFERAVSQASADGTKSTGTKSTWTPIAYQLDEPRGQTDASPKTISHRAVNESVWRVRDVALLLENS